MQRRFSCKVCKTQCMNHSTTDLHCMPACLITTEYSITMSRVWMGQLQVPGKRSVFDTVHENLCATLASRCRRRLGLRMYLRSCSRRSGSDGTGSCGKDRSHGNPRPHNAQHYSTI